MTTNDVAPTSQFGFEFIDETEVPDAPQKRDVDKERWEAVKMILEDKPGQWLKAKEYETAQGAQTKASQINNGSTKIFPSEKGWEARVKVTKKADPKEDDKGNSVLYLRYNPSSVTD
jgi:hypothetical protein